MSVQLVEKTAAPTKPRRYISMRPPKFFQGEQGGTFRLKVGGHVDYCPDGCQCDAAHEWEAKRQALLAQKKPDPGRCPDHRYEAYDDYTVTEKTLIVNGQSYGLGGYLARCYVDGVDPIPREQYTNDLIVSKLDLCARFNGPGPRGAKFDRVSEQVAAPAPPPPQIIVKPLEMLTDAELREYAEAEEIDLQGATKREDMLKRLRAIAAKPPQ